MTCPDCTTASQRPWYAFMASCAGCNARAIGRSPQFAAVRAAGRLDAAYKRALAACGVTHSDVKAAVAADKAHP